MAIPFRVVARPNPNDRTQPARFFGNIRANGELTVHDLANRISSQSTVSSIDTMAMMEALLQIIPEELANGRIIRLGELGSLRPFLRSESSESAEEFSSELISEVRLVFRPGRLVRNMLSSARFQRVE